MKNMLQFSKKLPAWQIEREKILQRACLSVQGRLTRGEKLSTAIGRVARRMNGRVFKCDPARRFKLASKRLLRLFYVWKRAGEVPSAFRLRYMPNRPTIRAGLLIRFIKFISQNCFPNMSAAWSAFQRQDSRAGSAGNIAQKVSYGKARYWLPAAAFYQIQAQIAARENAEKELSRLILITVSAIREKLPDRLPGPKRMKPGNNFEI